MSPEDIIDRAFQPEYAVDDSKHLVGYKHALAINPMCGDTCAVFVKVENDIIVDMRHKSEGCTICCCCADLLCEELISKSSNTAINLFSVLGIPIGINRRQCVVTPQKALLEALKCGAS